MINLCIPPDIAENLKSIALRSTTTQERERLFKEILGHNSDELVKQYNTLYERGLLLRNQERAQQKFIDELTGTSIEDKLKYKESLARDLQRRREMMYNPDGTLNPNFEALTSRRYEDIASFVKEKVDAKFGVNLTEEQTSKIIDVKNKIDIEFKKGKNENGNYTDEYGLYRDRLNEYIKDIKDPSNKMTLGGQAKYNYNVSKTKVLAEDTNFKKFATAVSEVAKVVTSPVFKSAKAAMDASFLGIQGLAVLMRSPTIFYNSVKQAAKSFEGPVALDAFRAKMFSWGGYDDAIESGLRLISSEEQFASNALEALTYKGFGPGKLFKISDDAFSMFLQNARMEEYKRVLNIRNLQRADKGLPPLNIKNQLDAQTMKEVASHANKVTGTSNLGSAEKYAGLLNSVMFAGRYAVSDIRNFTDVLNPTLSWEAKKLAINTLALNAGAVYGAYVTYAMLHPEDTEINPNAANFMKIKDNNGVMVGPKFKGQWMVQLIAKLLEGEEKSATGKITKYGEGYKAKTRGDVILHTARGKLAPVPSVLTDVLVGKDFANKPVTIGGEAKNLTAPIGVGNIIEDAFTSGDPALKQLQNAFYQLSGLTSYEVGK